MKKKLVSMLLASALLIGVMPMQIPAAEEMLEEETTEMVSEGEIIQNDENGIPDNVLYQAILSAGDTNGDGILTKDEAAEVTELGVYGCSDIEGIQLCTNLNIFSMSYTMISDISNLNSLEKLTRLDLWNNKIKDTDGLENLTNLEYLQLGNNEINDITKLKGLINLEDLALYGNQISDISALEGLTNLSFLDLSHNQISDISALSGLTNLNTLNLQRNQISDISALSGMINLTTLDLHHNNITDFGALSALNIPSLRVDEPVSEDEIIRNDESGIPDLTLYQKVLLLCDCNDDGKLTKEEAAEIANLWLTDDEVKTIEGIQYCTNLSDLLLYNNEISDISALSSLTNLSSLHIQGCQISDICVLSSLTNLSDLSISSCPISDISALGDMINLGSLSLWSNQISDISALGDLTNLSSLSIGNNQISDISALSGLINLSELYMRDNQISDISALSGLVNLCSLDIGNNQISDISALANLTNLRQLTLNHNNISDVSALSGLIKLEWLDLSYNNISDISTLGNLTNLRQFDMSYNQTRDFSALQELFESGRLNVTGNPSSVVYESPTDSTENASAVIDGVTVDFIVNPDAEAGCTTDAQESAYQVIMDKISNLIEEVGEDATKIYAPILQEYAEISVEKVLLAECIDIQKPDGVDMSQGVAVTFPAKVDIGDTVIVLHLDKEGNWEQIKDAKVTAEGWITGTFRSLSPVYYFKVEEKAADIGGGDDNKNPDDGNTDDSNKDDSNKDDSNTDSSNTNGNGANGSANGNATNSSSTSNGKGSPTASTGNAVAVINGVTVNFKVNSDAKAGCTTEAQKSAYQTIMDKIGKLSEGAGEDATKIYAPILQEYAKINVKKVWLAECIDIQKPDGVDMSQGVAVTFPAKVNKGDTVIVLHLDEAGSWELIEDAKATADGWITGTFKSLSPVFYFKVEMEGYDGWAGVSAEQKAKLMQESLAQKTAVVASPKTDDINANINASVMLLLAAALCGAALYGRRRRIKA